MCTLCAWEYTGDDWRGIFCTFFQIVAEKILLSFHNKCFSCYKHILWWPVDFYKSFGWNIVESAIPSIRRLFQNFHHESEPSELNTNPFLTLIADYNTLADPASFSGFLSAVHYIITYLDLFSLYIHWHFVLCIDLGWRTNL